MKSSLFSKIILASLGLLLAGSAVAVDSSHKASFQISTPAQINGTQLPAGEYVARWEGSGPTVQVNITQGRKVVATVPAQVVELDQAASNDETEVRNDSNGDRAITSLRFSGKKYSLALGTESAKAQNKTDSTN
jgi:hypothetical protein